MTHRRLVWALMVLLLLLPIASFGWKFVSIADSRGDSNGVNTAELTAIVNRINLENVDLVIFQGDAVSGSSNDSTLGSQMDTWLGVINGLNCPWYYTCGNHEVSTDTSENVLRSKVNQPTNGPADNQELVYSFDHENAHFAVLNSNHYGQTHVVQRTWLTTDLAGTTKPHKFVMAHEPAYPKGPHIGSSLDANAGERDAFWTTMTNAGVMMYFCGHEHLYSRSLHGSIYQIINGTCGAPISHVSGTIDKYHYVVVRIEGNNVYAEARNDTGGLLDSWSYTTSTPDAQPPSVPTEVTATAQSSSSIQVSWTASTDNIGVEGYKVYRNGSQVGTSATTSYLDTGLISNTTYSYTVSAYDGASNNSAQSPPATGTTLAEAQAPSVPTNVAAMALSSSSIQVTWTASTDNTGVTGYKVYRNAALAGTSSGTVYMDSGLAPSTTYSYTVSAYDGSGNNSAQSSPAVTAATRPAGGATLYANEDTFTYASENNITHNNLGIQTRYHSIYTRYGWLEFTFGSVGMTNATIYLYQYSDWGSNYSARLRGSQYDMDEATLTYLNQPSGAGSWTIAGNWNATTGARQYYSADITTFYNSHLGQKVTLRLESTTYGTYGGYYEDSEGSRLAAGDYTAPTPNYPKIEVTPDTTAPSVPSDVTATAKSPSVIRLTWTVSTDNVGVTGYRVFRDGSQVGTSATTSYTDTGLSPNTTYSYTVSAYDAASNNSAQSSPAATEMTMTAISIKAAKELSNTSSVGFVSKTVTAVYAGSFYVEESDRNAGIKVVAVEMPSGLTVGDMVDIGGVMQTGTDGERQIGNATATLRLRG